MNITRRIVLIISIAICFITVAPHAYAENPITPEEIIEKLSADINDPNPYFDRMFFSDEFKTEVIQKEFNATPKEYDRCMRQTALVGLQDLRFQISVEKTQYAPKIVYTDKKLLMLNMNVWNTTSLFLMMTGCRLKKLTIFHISLKETASGSLI